MLVVLLYMALFFPSIVFASDELQRLNAIRAEAGLNTLRSQPDLAEAARRHAAYLDRHREPGQDGQGSAHEQVIGRHGFSGVTPVERALAAGYPHRQVLENVSMGYADTGAAMHGLMGAIYHRLTFLDFQIDEVGIAVGKRSRVFVLGRSDMGRLCANPSSDALLRQPVDCLGQRMKRSNYEKLCTSLPERARFKPAYPVACPGGQRLDADFMAATCQKPPLAARFRGQGRYYRPCGDDTRIDATWFQKACSGAIPGARHTAGNSYYTLCDDVLDNGVAIQAEWFEGYCARLPAGARYTDSMRYRLPCAANHKLRGEYLDTLDHKRLREKPELLVWPAEGAQDIPPAFFVEEPDPLPDRDVSGYPVSIQVNPAHVRHVELQSFTLQRLSGDALNDVGPLRLLDHKSDPNKLLNSHQFALFPLQRLDWGATYFASAELLLDGSPQRLSWSFTTSGKELPLLLADGPDQQFSIQPGNEYFLYLPPGASGKATVSSARYQHAHDTKVLLEPLDANTLKVRVETKRCDTIEIRFDSGRDVTLLTRPCQR